SSTKDYPYSSPGIQASASTSHSSISDSISMLAGQPIYMGGTMSITGATPGQPGGAGSCGGGGSETLVADTTGLATASIELTGNVGLGYWNYSLKLTDSNNAVVFDLASTS